MIAFDTNVLVRVLLGDDPAQTKIAEEQFTKAADGEGVYIGHIVLAELVWVMRTGYRLSDAAVRERIRALVRTRGVHVPQLEVVLEALRRDEEGAANLADYLILAGARADGAHRMVTFDRRLAREEDVTLVRA